MDKLELLLDMIEHPERYSEQQIHDLLADEEVRKHYDVMVRLREAYGMECKSERVKNERMKKEKYELFFIRKIAAVFIVVAFLGGLAWAGWRELWGDWGGSDATAQKSVSSGVPAGMVTAVDSLVRFADVRLDSILAVVGSHYGKQVCFRDDGSRAMRLITTWNPADSLVVFIEHLNRFDYMQLTLKEDTIFVESINEEE